MPTYLDFDSSRDGRTIPDIKKGFRDFLIGKTLKNPEGPQTFTANSYVYKETSDYPNLDPGTVINYTTDLGQRTREDDLSNHKRFNTFKPEEYFIIEDLNEYTRRANLKLYANNAGTPYFVAENHNLVGIMNTAQYENESELFKFAASYIRDPNSKGPVYSRIQQNLEAATIGRVRLIDALQGNTATAINIVTGREPLVETNNKITVASTLAGKTVDFLQTVGGVEFPFTEIPGDYLSNPRNPINVRPTPATEFGKVAQDITGVLGSLLGIQRRPKLSQKPSDIFVEYLGQGQRQVLFDLLSYSKYAPNYTTTARSQQSSKLFSFADKFAQGAKNLLGLEAPTGVAYIGDDRGNDVNFAMNDFNDRPIRSGYYLSLLFDPVQTQLFQRIKNISEGGDLSGKLTWISTSSGNELGANNDNYPQQSSKYLDTLSTEYQFREDSILGYTQEILNTMPTNIGEARSHVGNVIDQTSRIFREGDVYLSRGSAIQYVDKYGQNTGVEYCRTWTKDRPYLSYSDTMKKGMNIRLFEGSVMSNPWNLNIGPISDGNKDFEGSTNIFSGYRYGTDADGKSFYAKKYMFSIENLAWKTSTLPGFTVLDLPVCERGPNGGRVMWFPPYALTVNETNSANWEENEFIGRPEPIYTYKHTKRSATISFKVVVDHPSILNLLVREHFKNMSDEEAENYINAFFAGCENLDFYELINTYKTLDRTDIIYIQKYLNSTNPKPEYIFNIRVIPDKDNEGNNDTILTTTEPGEEYIEKTTVGGTMKLNLNFRNDYPKGEITTFIADEYGKLYADYITKKNYFKSRLTLEIKDIINNTTSAGYENPNPKADRLRLFGDEKPTTTKTINELIDQQHTDTETNFKGLESRFNEYTTTLTDLKTQLTEGIVESITLNLFSTTSTVATIEYNRSLAIRRCHSVLIDLLKKITNGSTPSITWIKSLTQLPSNPKDVVEITGQIKLKDLGYGNYDDSRVLTFTSYNYGEDIKEVKFGTQLDARCKDTDYAMEGLDFHSPISFLCRQVEIDLKWNKITKEIKPPDDNTIVTPDPPKNDPRLKIDIERRDPKPDVPNIDIMKRIIMKTLSECYYFKKLEESSPLQFSSLKEKLKYFHPGFHSTTPEGLNSRLTFLHQCIRPADTIPIKGISDVRDLNARNTSFGPPPICILRIGDFYHSKIVIKDVSIQFEENATWDLNPEGIGVQPMIANVTLQVNFIGGQGLEKPVERLQNALSSNFYANTEMYDERSTATNTMIGGETASGFTKDFLEKLIGADQEVKDLNVKNTSKGNEIKEYEYIGNVLTPKLLRYSQLINDVFTNVAGYFDTYKSVYDFMNKTYGPKLLPMMFSQTYRSVKDFDVFGSLSPTPTKTLELFGFYKKGKEFSELVKFIQKEMLDKLSTESPSAIFGFDTVITTDKVVISDQKLRKFLETFIVNEFDVLVSQNIKELQKIETQTLNLVKSLDKLNFLVKYGFDATIKKDKGYYTNLEGFTSTSFYQNYSKGVDFISDNTSKLYEKLDNTINFFNPSISSDTFSEILSYLLQDQTYIILNVYRYDTKLWDEKTLNKFEKKLESFIAKPKTVEFKFKKYPSRKDDNNIDFTQITPETEITDNTTLTELKSLMSDKNNKLGSKLNYYKP